MRVAWAASALILCACAIGAVWSATRTSVREEVEPVAAAFSAPSRPTAPSSAKNAFLTSPTGGLPPATAPVLPLNASTLRSFYAAHVPRPQQRRGDVALRGRHESTPGVKTQGADAAVDYVDDAVLAACPLTSGAHPQSVKHSFTAKCKPDPPCALRQPPSFTRRAYAGIIPDRVATGESPAEAIQRALRFAWGESLPRIDLYVRAGCGAMEELHWLYPTVEVFWPSFLGDVIVVLDDGDAAAMEAFRPLNHADTKHSYRFVFEKVPCMPGRFFNQVSYTHLDRLSGADFVVTIDSDCVFHTPVTPELLFDDRGRLLLPHSAKFQNGTWTSGVEHFTGPHSFQWQTMVSQPVAFAVPTFAAYRKYVKQLKPESCYYDEVLRLLEKPKDDLAVKGFCWMCQLGTFIGGGGDSADLYCPVDLDTPYAGQYMRYGAHVTYEGHGLREYSKRARGLVTGGLCRSIRHLLKRCAPGATNYVNDCTFYYSYLQWGDKKTHKGVIDAYSARFQLAEVLSRPQ